MWGWRRLFGSTVPAEPKIDAVRRLRDGYARLGSEELKRAAREATSVAEVLAVTAVVASRVLALDMFDVQLEGALALTDGAIVEMQTGEGKTLAAVPAVVWHARVGNGVHVLTANDYLAGRDADWMRGIYEELGLTVGAIRQGLGSDERRAAYRKDVTYATVAEVGFDYLRDQLALHSHEQVHRPFAAAVIDEADSILIDEARIPLVISGGTAEPPHLAARADQAVRPLVPGLHYTVERQGRDVALTDPGVALVEKALGCPNLYEAEHLPLMTAVQDALHAHALLRRDVDYLVQGEAVLSVDELKGRVVHDRRWPAGLQTALELKEGVPGRKQGRVLGSITVQNLVGLYPAVCGMTGTAATQADEFREVYGLEVVVIPTNRPVIRIDQEDRVFDARAEKEAAVLAEIHRLHRDGRPVLVGTGSVEESERLSGALAAVPHHVLNARNEAAEAEIVARAGEPGAVTISTNMAGRGVDIRLGPGVAGRGGLHVIGTNRHESRRIDNQLRGRAGRQGDPGHSQFFVSREDPLMARDPGDETRPDTPDGLQRRAEGQSLDVRLFLRKYEGVVEGQRRAIQERRQDVLDGTTAGDSELERLVTLTTIDDLWADYVAAVSDVRASTVWVALTGGDPFREYLGRVHAMFGELERAIAEEIPVRLAQAETAGFDAAQRGATWTYLTTDQPFGSMSERILRGIRRMFRERRRRG